MIISALMLLAATAWTVAVVDTIVESANAAKGQLVAFGRTIASPGPTTVIWILCVLAASAALAMAAAIGRIRDRRYGRGMSAEIDARLASQAQEDARNEGRRQLLSWRLAELRTQVEDLTEQRDRLNRELGGSEYREDRLVDVGLRRRRRPDRGVVVMPETQETRPGN
jgi:hypothetical protein